MLIVDLLYESRSLRAVWCWCRNFVKLKFLRCVRADIAIELHIDWDT